MQKICDNVDCTACMSCIMHCPKNCITMIPDENGMESIHIDQKNCIECGICKKICHVNNKINYNIPSKAFAVIASDSNDKDNSSSGGLAYILAKNYILNGGVVYATVYENGEVCFKRFTDDTVIQIKGSKYVLSYMNDTIIKIKNDLLIGKNCMFIGTPCQVASVKCAVGFKNMFYVDLICHGVPSQYHLKEYLQSITKDNIKNIKFRKSNIFQLSIFTERKEIVIPMELSIYLKGFMKGFYYRESCYKCNFARRERVGDITIGDFWGLGTPENKYIFKAKQDNSGISLAIINSIDGEKQFENIKPLIYFEERKIEEALKGNSQLNYPSSKHKNYDKFSKYYSSTGYNKSAKKCLMFDMVKSKLRYFLSKANIYKIGIKNDKQ